PDHPERPGRRLPAGLAQPPVPARARVGGEPAERGGRGDRRGGGHQVAEDGPVVRLVGHVPRTTPQRAGHPPRRPPGRAGIPVIGGRFAPRLPSATSATSARDITVILVWQTPAHPTSDQSFERNPDMRRLTAGLACAAVAAVIAPTAPAAHAAADRPVSKQAAPQGTAAKDTQRKPDPIAAVGKRLAAGAGVTVRSTTAVQGTRVATSTAAFRLDRSGLAA